MNGDGVYGKSVRVCPHCSYEVNENGLCSSCGRKLNLNEWPFEDVYSAKGLTREIVCGKVRYILPRRTLRISARVNEDAADWRYEIPYQDPLGMGSSRSDMIRITSADSVKVVFYRDRYNDCWILDQSEFACVRINDSEPVRNCRLRSEDVIDVAGIRLSFDGESVFPASAVSDGVVLSARDVGISVEGKVILRDVSFTVKPGEFVGVLGPSGCGKSTLLQHIAGLTSNVDCSGNVTFNGVCRDDIPGKAVGICAYLPQNAEEMLHSELSLREEMECFLAVHGVKDCSSNQIDSILELLGLSGATSTLVSKLSGGQKRRAAIAMTLLRRPAVLLLDEPTAGLDPSSDAEVMMYLKKIAENKGISILCSTHVLGNMNCFSKIMAFTSAKNPSSDLKGRLVFCDRPGKLIAKVCSGLNTSTVASGDVVAVAAERLYNVYDVLMDGAPKLKSVKDAAAGFESDLPEDLSIAPSAKDSFKGYLKRMWTAFRFRVNGGENTEGGWVSEFFSPLRTVARFLHSSMAFLFLWLPAGIMTCIRIGCDKDFTEPLSGALYFCCLIALFLLGLCHSATRLVDDRIPSRCLERLAGVSHTSYLCAKIAGSVGLCLTQTLSFCLFWQIAISLPREWFSTEINPSSPLVGPLKTYWTMPVLFISSMMGSLVGLSVSAMVKERTAAVNCVPVVAVVVLFFSQPNIGYRLSDVLNEKRDTPPMTAELVSYATPTVIPQRFLISCYQRSAAAEIASRSDASEMNMHYLEVVEKDFKRVSLKFILVAALYFVLAVLVLWRFEPLRESEWNGR